MIYRVLWMMVCMGVTCHLANGHDTLPALPSPLPVATHKKPDTLTLGIFSDDTVVRNGLPGRSGLKIAGICMVSASYGLAVVMSVVLNNSKFEMDHRVAGVLWIPLAGPIAADIVDQWENPVATMMCWSWSLAEILGTSFIISGARRERKQRHRLKASVQPALQVGGTPGIVCNVIF